MVFAALLIILIGFLIVAQVWPYDRSLNRLPWDRWQPPTPISISPNGLLERLAPVAFAVVFVILWALGGLP